MTTQKETRLAVISNATPNLEESKNREPDIRKTTNYHSNPMYQKLLEFKNLQEQQKKKFSVDDLFKLC